MKFGIEYYPTDRDIKEMILLDKDVFNMKDTASFSKVKSWYKKNNEIYTVLKLDDVVVGYINFMPITKPCYDKFIIGKYKDYMLTSKDITKFVKGDNYCLAMSIVVRKDLRDTKAIIKLWKGFLYKINKFKKQGIKIASIVADCVSIDGVKFFISNYNGKYICNSEDWGKIYEGNISNKYNRLPEIQLKPLNKYNIKTAAKFQYEIFKNSNSVGYCDYLDEIYNNGNITGGDWSQNYLIYYKNKPVGIIGLLKYDKYPEDIWLNWFGVMPKYRDKGIGTSSLIKIIKLARKYNVKNFRLFTYEMWYKVAQNIYRKTMQLEEVYLNSKDEQVINQQGSAKVYSISLVDKVCDKWDNKFLNLISELDLSKRSIKKLKEDGFI